MVRDRRGSHRMDCGRGQGRALRMHLPSDKQRAGINTRAVPTHQLSLVKLAGLAVDLQGVSPS
jgi:hypothetical protein